MLAKDLTNRVTRHQPKFLSRGPRQVQKNFPRGWLTHGEPRQTGEEEPYVTGVGTDSWVATIRLVTIVFLNKVSGWLCT